MACREMYMVTIMGNLCLGENICEAIFKQNIFLVHVIMFTRSHSYLIDIRDTTDEGLFRCASSSETNERKRPEDRKFHTGSPVFKIPS